METYAAILNFAIPVFLFLILLEYAIGLKMGKSTIRAFDSVSSISSGITNILKDVLGLAVIIISYDWLVSKLALASIPNSPWVYLIAFIGLDFAGYWSHRLEHMINLFWNRHIIHHSSEEYNLSCALRQNISAIFKIFTFLLIPMAFLGVPAQVVAVLAPIHLFAQFWYHTTLIKKMGWLEYVIVTPSHHRVHHAINDQYLDKNFSPIFIIWDKIFGTFQEELETEPPVFGVKRQANTWNPILINYQHFYLLVKDAITTKNWKDKILLWFKPTGYRPADREQADPVPYIENAAQQVKYDTYGSLMFKAWTWIQLFVTTFLMLYLFNNLSDIGVGWALVYGFVLLLGVSSYTSLMDRSKLSYVTELLRLTIVLVVIFYQKSWFGIEDSIPFGTVFVLTYFVISIVANFIFMKEPVEYLEPSGKLANMS